MRLLLGLVARVAARWASRRGLSLAVGAFLLVWAASVAWVSVGLSRSLAWEVAGVNSVWVVASVVFGVSRWVDLTGLGVAFVLVQAAAVAGLVGMQASALRGADAAVVDSADAALER